MSGTIDYEIATLSAMYHEARKDKQIEADTMPGQFIIIGDQNPRPPITDKQFENLLKHTDPDFTDVLTCAYESAMRNSEIRNVTPAQVHLNVQDISGLIFSYIDLGIFDSKNNVSRSVPVTDRLKAILERRMDGLDSEDMIFTNKNRKYSLTAISNKMKQACERAKLPYGDKVLNNKGEKIGLLFHSFRSTRISKWVELGYSDEIIRRASGHRNLKTFQRYVKIGPSSVFRLVQDPQNNSGTKKALSLAV